jgi:large subunit ribosomal protein L31
MKKEIHPKMFEVTAKCVCGVSFETTSTTPRIEMDICSACHPFFTGKQKFVDTAGRIDKFQRRYENAKKKTSVKKVAKAEPKAAEAKKTKTAK